MRDGGVGRHARVLGEDESVEVGEAVDVEIGRKRIDHTRIVRTVGVVW